MAKSIAALRLANSVLARVAPGASARLAARLFTTPRRHALPPRELVAEREGERVELDGGLSALRWRPREVTRGRIVALHGWSGRATQWGPLARPATSAGWELIAVDAPAHGHSQGRRAHPVAFAEALFAAEARFGPFAAVIGHSMGGAAAALALSRGLRAERAVLIASPCAVEGILRGFAAWIGLTPAAEARFVARIEALTGLPPDELDLAELTSDLPQPALVVHSRDDREIDFTAAETIVAAWPGARLLALDGLGHRRILRSEALVEASISFLAREFDAELARAG